MTFLENQYNWLQVGEILIDVETTDLDPQLGSMIEATLVSGSGNVWSQSFRPRPGCKVTGKALEVNGNTLETLDAKDLGYYAAIKTLAEFICEEARSYEGDLVLCGWSVDFDRQFLAQAWQDAGRNRPIPVQHRVDDLHTLTRRFLRRLGHDLPKSIYSSDAAALLGVEPEPLPHRSFGGVAMEAAMYAKILNHKH